MENIVQCNIEASTGNIDCLRIFHELILKHFELSSFSYLNF